MSEDTNKIPQKSDQIEYIKSWKDRECFETLCAFANTKGGTLYIGMTDNSIVDSIVTGVPDAKNVSIELKIKIEESLNIIPTIDVDKKEGKDIVQIEIELSNNPVKHNDICYIRENSVNRKLEENTHTEFKEFWIKEGDYFKSLCAFCNTGGGTLYFGINDDGEAVGVQKKNSNNIIGFVNLDTLSETLSQQIYAKLKIIPEVKRVKINEKDIVRVEVNSKDFPVTYNGRCYKRSDRINLELTMEELSDFILKKKLQSAINLTDKSMKFDVGKIKENQNQLRLLIQSSDKMSQTYPNKSISTNNTPSSKEKAVIVQTLNKTKHTKKMSRQPIISTVMSAAMLFSFSAFSWFSFEKFDNIDNSMNKLSNSVSSFNKQAKKLVENIEVLSRMNGSGQENSEPINSQMRPFTKAERKSSPKLERDRPNQYDQILKDTEEKTKKKKVKKIKTTDQRLF